MTSVSFARFLIVQVRAQAARARREGRSDLGASALEWAIISAIIAGLAILVATQISDVVKGRTEQIKGE
jgi:Flp pilus assembly pilin Flp